MGGKSTEIYKRNKKHDHFYLLMSDTAHLLSAYGYILISYKFLAALLKTKTLHVMLLRNRESIYCSQMYFEFMLKHVYPCILVQRRVGVLVQDNFPPKIIDCWSSEMNKIAVQAFFALEHAVRSWLEQEVLLQDCWQFSIFIFILAAAGMLPQDDDDTLICVVWKNNHKCDTYHNHTYQICVWSQTIS